MIGTIQKANKSKSGKTISIQVDGTWYTSKNWELESAINRRIIFEPSPQTFPDGTTIQWLNDYVFEDQSSTPAAQAMDEAMQVRTNAVPIDDSQPPPMGNAAPLQNRPAQVNKDALIGALALTKSITGQKEQVWEAFRWFYHKMDTFDPTEPY